MKIGINLLQYTDVQGIETFAWNILGNLPLRDDDEIFLFTNQKSKQIFRGIDPRFKIINRHFPILNSLTLTFFEQFCLPIKLKKHKIDLLFCPSLSGPWFFRRKIMTIHDLAFKRFREESKFIPRLYLYGALLSAKYFSLAVATVSEFSKQELISLAGINPKKITVISEGVPETAAMTEKENAEKILEKFNLSGHKFFIYIGNVRPRKNLPTTLEAFKKFGLDYPEYYFVLAGKKNRALANLKETIKKIEISDKVILTGFISDQEKSALLSSATALIFVSLYEGFGLPVLEAQALGTPVLISSAAALPEIAGDSALTTNSNDEEDIAQKMRGLAEDETLCSELIAMGRENIKRYSWKSGAESLMKLFYNYENSSNK